MASHREIHRETKSKSPTSVMKIMQSESPTSVVALPSFDDKSSSSKGFDSDSDYDADELVEIGDDEEALFLKKVIEDETITTSSFSSINSSYFAALKGALYQNNNNFRFLLLVLLVFQTSASIVTGRYTRSSVPEEELYEISHLVFTIECVKFVASLILEHLTTGGKLLESLDMYIWKQPLDSLKTLVPAALYVVQGSLIFIALSNLSAPIFVCLQQGKLVCTAVVSVLMLKRSYSTKQWICLCTLALGVATIAVGEKLRGKQRDKDMEVLDSWTEEEEESKQRKFLVGVLAVTAACFSSAFAGVYFEKVLAPEKASKTKSNDAADNDNNSSTPTKATITTTKNEEKEQQQQHKKTPSLYIRNIQLAFFSMIIAYLQASCENGGGGDTTTTLPGEEEGPATQYQSSKPFFFGFKPSVWFLVALQAWGGLLVSAVMKYADNVLKGLAAGLAVVVSSFLSVLLFHVHLSSQFFSGAVIITVSVYLFSNDIAT